MEILAVLLQREVIVGTAILGAIVAMVGNAMIPREDDAPPGRGRTVLRVGYGITFASIALFIVAGFLSGR